MVEADDHGWQQQHREHHHQRVAEIGSQVIPGLQLHMERSIAPQDFGQDFLAGLNQSFGPAGLLGLEGGHFNWQFRRTLHVLEVNKLPAFQLSPVREIRVFRERVVLPATCFLDCLTAPNACRAIEVEENATSCAPRVLQHEMPVE